MMQTAAARLLCGLAAALLLAVRAGAETVAVYHTSDAHGWYSARPAAWDRDYPARLIGGYPALAAVLKKEKHPRLLLDSGDLFQGSPEGILTKGAASLELMNLLGYDAAVPGNHDYDYGEANFGRLAALARFPFVAANIKLRDGGRPAYLKPYTIVKKGSRRIAVVGLAGAHMASSTLPAHTARLSFGAEAESAAAVMEEVRGEKPDAVIVITHLSLSDRVGLKNLDVSTWTFTPEEGSLAVARAAPGVNLVLGGHHHAGLLKGWRDPVSGTWFGESGYGLSQATRAELDFEDGGGPLRGVEVELLPLWTDQTGEDAAVKKTVGAVAARAEKEMGRVIGLAEADLLFSADGTESGIGSWLCDLTREAAGTDLAFHNNGGIRAQIKKGPVRLRDLYQVMPFDNTIITMKLTGAQLRRLLADNLRGDHISMQVSGLEAAFSGGKVTALRRGGREIGDAEVFTAATNNYLAFGGIGGAVFSEGAEVKDTRIPVREAMRRAVEKAPITSPPPGRLVRK